MLSHVHGVLELIRALGLGDANAQGALLDPRQFVNAKSAWRPDAA